MQQYTKLFKHQSALAAYCRTGTFQPIPGVDPDRAFFYRQLVFNVIDDMVRGAYPLTYDLVSEQDWSAAVHDFFSNSPCMSPQVWSMPKEFQDYLLNTHHPLIRQYPVLNSLLPFEWLELELFMMEDLNLPENGQERLIDDQLVINPEHRFLHLLFPVHRKKAELIHPDEQGNYYLAAHRKPDDGNVIFTDLSPAMVRLLEYLSHQSMSFIQLICCFEEEFQMALRADEKENIKNFFEEAIKTQLILQFQS